MPVYTQTDEQIHYLSQILAKVNRAYLPAQADDSHTNLFFDPLSQRLFGHWIDGPSGNLILTLNLARLSFEWLNESHRILHEIPITGKTLAELEILLGQDLEGRGFDPQAIARPLHFEIPRYRFANEPIAEFDPAGLSAWSFFRSLANDAAAALLGYLQVAGEVRIWPHHFDTGIYAQVSDTLGIGFGLAMADNIADAPYFYLAGYAKEPLTFDHLPNLDKGKWSTGDGWRGAYLPIHQIPRDSLKRARSHIDQFMVTGAAWYLNHA